MNSGADNAYRLMRWSFCASMLALELLSTVPAQGEQPPVQGPPANASQALLKAIALDDEQGVKSALDNGADLSAGVALSDNTLKYPPLVWSIVLSSAKAQEIIASRHPDLSVQNWIGVRTAARYSKVDLLKELVVSAGLSLPRNTPLLSDIADRAPLPWMQWYEDKLKSMILGPGVPINSSPIPANYLWQDETIAVDGATFLLDQHFDVNAETPITTAIELGDVLLADLLAARGATLPGSDWRTDLFKHAIEKGNQAGIKQLQSDGVTIQKANSDGWSPLELAITYAQPSIAKDLLSAGADPNFVPIGHSSPMALAASAGFVDVVSELLSRQADPNLIDSAGDCSLCGAIRSGRIDILKLLLKLGAQPNIRLPNGDTVLHEVVLPPRVTIDRDKLSSADHIVSPEQLLMVKILAGAGFDFSAHNKQNQSILSNSFSPCSAYCKKPYIGDFDYMNALVAAGEKIESGDMLAAAPFNDVLAWLLDHDGDPNARDENGRPLIVLANEGSMLRLMQAGAFPKEPKYQSPLLKNAVDYGDQEAIKVLLSKGMSADTVFVAPEPYGVDMSALEYALYTGKADAIRALAEGGADIYQVKDDGNTALHRVIAYNPDFSKVAVAALIEEGFDLNTKNNAGKSVADVAVAYGGQRSARLQEAIGQVSISDSALQKTVRAGDRAALDALLQGGTADIDAQDKLGRTSLTLALTLGKLDLAKDLLLAGANPSFGNPSLGLVSDVDYIGNDRGLITLMAIQLMRNGRLLNLAPHSAYSDPAPSIDAFRANQRSPAPDVAWKVGCDGCSPATTTLKGNDQAPKLGLVATRVDSVDRATGVHRVMFRLGQDQIGPTIHLWRGKTLVKDWPIHAAGTVTFPGCNFSSGTNPTCFPRLTVQNPDPGGQIAILGNNGTHIPLPLNEISVSQPGRSPEPIDPQQTKDFNRAVGPVSIAVGPQDSPLVDLSLILKWSNGPDLTLYKGSADELRNRGNDKSDLKYRLINYARIAAWWRQRDDPASWGDTIQKNTLETAIHVESAICEDAYFKDRILPDLRTSAANLARIAVEARDLRDAITKNLSKTPNELASEIALIDQLITSATDQRVKDESNAIKAILLQEQKAAGPMAQSIKIFEDQFDLDVDVATREYEELILEFAQYIEPTATAADIQNLLIRGGGPLTLDELKRAGINVGTHASHITDQVVRNAFALNNGSQ